MYIFMAHCEDDSILIGFSIFIERKDEIITHLTGKRVINFHSALVGEKRAYEIKREIMEYFNCFRFNKSDWLKRVHYKIVKEKFDKSVNT